MPLIARLIIAVVALLAAATLLASGMLQSGIGASYAQIERDAAQREARRLVNALEIEARSLGQLLLGWAHWSEMYAYAGAPTEAFRNENLTPAVLLPSDLAWVLVIAADGRLLDAVAAPSTSSPAPDLGSLQAPANPLFRALTGPIKPAESHCGVARLGAESYLVCRRPIRDTRAEQAPRGLVVLARRFDATLMRRVQAESHVSFVLVPHAAAANPELAGAPIDSAVFGSNRPLFRSSEATLEVRQPVSDLGGEVFGDLVMQLPREISALGQSSLERVRLKLFGIAALLAALLVFAIDRVLVYRLRRLSREIDTIRDKQDWSMRVSESRHDEIGRLATHANALLGVLETNMKDLEALATTDALTGVANRRAFNDRLALALRRQQRSGAGLALVMLDIDLFKPFNDRYGHAAGDHALEKVAAVMRSAAARATDLCARLGGEEFAILLEDADAAAAMNVAKHIRFTIEGLGIPHKTSPFGRLTVSLGVAIHQDGEDGETFYMRADTALYAAKEGGRNRIECARDGLAVLIESPGTNRQV
ncbi:diguanylate cyclase [Niveibacterium sp. 24ML]|uniref:GGDEF domain-containing protein n=1 Tax=Niveibacterium sp. 24ML TaxID=2985512 RepID=UPI00226F9F36|nr:diguanylate cyclase [Niveibacterium sp. 24ML]MCX9156204.1 diguanylate cyclase [Niveibacterium sp. 24ML]